ncbi:gliding motility-associated C-terminal domain-containing protein [Mucilaginibacter sp. ZT4R22]|uniref:Gliding motility-associated C-terminal domain-containing protein n=1 Tax=Mucilaginibacter pankratovii TaxID=2772110 RepID=A0ABR7WYM7_9SPHI|nr:gliding motility-associated C-terminal domain-containing protein [Mucilaginibacter pankratovii]MBD1367388.1 gliding motility-associated C-terminal domain-containing protein [Mucilaginibacter pankratovii]
MHNKALRLIIFFCSYLNFFAASAQAPAVRYAAKYTITERRKAVNSNVTVNAVITSVLPPSISYQTPQQYVINATITPLVPSNTGGTVPAAIYGQSSDYLGGIATATGVTVDAAGNVYVADWGTNQIIKITPAGQRSVFAGSGGRGRQDGQGVASSFNTPDALATDAAGNIYVSDQANNLIRMITPGGLVSTLAGSGNAGAADGKGAAASFDNPRGLTIDANGDIYVADQANNVVRKITPDGTVSTIAATFSTPTGVDIDADGNLYISDSSNGAIRKISKAGVVSTLATGLTFPRELRVDGTGNVYVSDQDEGRIKRISPAGVVTVIAGNGAGSGANFFSSPIGLMLDGKGNLFVAAGGYGKKVVISGYTIDKALPPGMSFDVKTGIITGKPTSLWPQTVYTINAYNGGGSSTTTLSIEVLLTAPLKQSIITLPKQDPNLDANNNYNPNGTSTNNETPITYTSSNPAVAVPTANGLIHLVGPGVSTITANQAGNANYYPASPVSQQLTVVEYLYVDMLPINPKTICDGDFNTETSSSNSTIPVTYTSSNPAVATISPAGAIHIVGVGTTSITISQNANPPLYVSATPVSRTLTVSMPQLPTINISATYQSPCAGDAITFAANAQNKGAKPNYQWQVNSINAGNNSDRFVISTLKKDDIVTCTIINTDDNCVAGYPVVSNPITVDVIIPQTPSVSIVPSANSVLAGTAITFTATVSGAIGTVNYQWYNNGELAGDNSPVFESNSFANGDVVTCTAIPVAACSTPAHSLPVTVIVVQKVSAPNMFTPNGDGTNDVWNISGIASYPKCIVNIYNRYGSPVFQSRGYRSAWNGTANGGLLPASTYYYVINLGFKNQTVTGYVTILR